MALSFYSSLEFQYAGDGKTWYFDGLVIFFAIGVVIGSIITRIINRPLDIGTLRIDTSDPDGPFMFLELSKDVDSVTSKKYEILKVIFRRNNSPYYGN